MRYGSARGFVVLAICMVLSLAVAACGADEPLIEPPDDEAADPAPDDEDEPEEDEAPEEEDDPAEPEVGEDDPIKIGMIGPLTGPQAVIGNAMRRGCEAAVNRFNEEGGVDGRPVELIVEDNEFAAANSVAAARKLIDQDGVVNITCTIGAHIAEALGPVLEDFETSLIVLTEADGASDPPREQVFVLPQTWTLGLGLMIDQGIAELGLESFSIAHSEDEAGQNMVNIATNILAEYDKELVEVEGIPLDATDVSSNALALRSADADAVIIQLLGEPGAQIIQEMVNAGYTPVVLGMSAYNGLDQLNLVGADNAEAVNLTAMSYYDLPWEETEGGDQFVADMEEYFPAEADTAGLLEQLGYASAHTVLDALTKIDGSITKESVRQSLEANGPHQQVVAPPAEFGPFDPDDPNTRRGQHSVFLTRYNPESGLMERLTEWVYEEGFEP